MKTCKVWNVGFRVTKNYIFCFPKLMIASFHFNLTIIESNHNSSCTRQTTGSVRKVQKILSIFSFKSFATFTERTISRHSLVSLTELRGIHHIIVIYRASSKVLFIVIILSIVLLTTNLARPIRTVRIPPKFFAQIYSGSYWWSIDLFGVSSMN